MLVYNLLIEEQIYPLKIKLLSNDFVSEWKKYLLKCSKNYKEFSWKTIHCSIIGGFNSNTQSLKFHWDLLYDLKNSFIILNPFFEYDFNDDILYIDNLKDITELTQEKINKWHRIFTTLATISYANEYYHGNQLVPSKKSTSQVRWIRSDLVHEKIHTINQIVHEFEKITYGKLERRQKFKNCKLINISAFASKDISLSSQVFSDKNDISAEFDCLKENCDYDVWINEDIQGKDHFKGWLDHDDLTQSDIWGNTFMTPNVTLDIDKIYYNITKDEDFKKEYMNSNKPLNRWPLGNIIDMKDIVYNNRSNKIVSVYLDSIRLW